jgi:hypothetical protein
MSSRPSKPPPSPSDHDNDDDRSVNLLAPSQDLLMSIDLPSLSQDLSVDLLVPSQDISVDRHAPSHDAQALSPVENTHALSGFIHPFRRRAIHEKLVWRGRNLRAIGDKGLFADLSQRMVRFQMPDPPAECYNTDDDSDESVGHRRSSQRTRFLLDDDDVLDDDGEDDDANDAADNHDAADNYDAFDDHDAAEDDGADVDADADHSIDEMSMISSSVSEGTVVPSTAYDIITAAGRRQSIERRVPASLLQNLDPIHE